MIKNKFHKVITLKNRHNSAVVVDLRVILFFALIMLMPIKAQTIEYKKNIVDSVKYGIDLTVKGAYRPSDSKILLDEGWIDAMSIRVFLHELGHHIWYNGNIDTTAILNDLAGQYFNIAEVKELFAEQHLKYFFNDCAPAFHNIFEAFYNRDKSKK